MPGDKLIVRALSQANASTPPKSYAAPITIMRLYEPIWQELKKKGSVRLAVPRAIHRRVIKAVLKEKNMDIGFKYEMLEKKIRLRITYQQQDNVISIKLNRSFTFLTSVCASDI